MAVPWNQMAKKAASHKPPRSTINNPPLQPHHRSSSSPNHVFHYDDSISNARRETKPLVILPPLTPSAPVSFMGSEPPTPSQISLPSPTPSTPVSPSSSRAVSPRASTRLSTDVSQSPRKRPTVTLSPEQSDASFARLLSKSGEDDEEGLEELDLDKPQRNADTSAEGTSVSLSQSDSFQLAMYIAMAHAALILGGITLYFIALLLKDFWWPILWALLCSMPLREVQDSIVGFWQPYLQHGLTSALCAPLSLIYDSVAQTIFDFRRAALRIAARANKSLGPPPPRRNATGFERLSDWMVTLAVFTIGYDIIGIFGLCIGALGGLVYFYLKSKGKLQAVMEQRKKATATLRDVWGWITAPITAPYQVLDRQISQQLLAHLNFLVAVSLIVGMVLGSLSLALFFSYRIAMEGKQAVVSLNTHVRSSNYAETLGVNQWLEENHVAEMIDNYTDKAYYMVEEQIDNLGRMYNMTSMVDVAKAYITRGKGAFDPGAENGTGVMIAVPDHPLLVTAQSIKRKLLNSEFQGAAEEAQATLTGLLSQYNINRDELIEKAKAFAGRAAESGKAFLVNGGSLFFGGVATLSSIGKAIASGAADVVNFVAQSVFFFSVLYYLMVSETGGVWDQVVGMIPLSDKARERSAAVLNNAVSAVLLSTVKTAIFQTLFTWLLLRFFRIHFLYVSTLFAAVSIIPIFPLWLASVPMGLELAFAGKYTAAVVLVLFHQWAMGYGEGAIKDDIPDYNPSLMSLSIAGGMALFHSASQGAILGPLLMTMLLAVKNLYAEFVLGVERESKNSQQLAKK